LDIDDDVVQAVKEIATHERSTVGRVVSALARRGLAARSMKSRNTRVGRGGVPPLPSRGEIMTLGHVRNLMDRDGF
jgi:hypothetical protein